MNLFKLFVLFLFLLPLHLMADDGNQTNILLFKDAVQVTSSINEYENVIAGMPIKGLIMVTHNSIDTIDKNSFRLGDKPLKADFVSSSMISPYSKLTVTIFSFQLPGMTTGAHQLPPIKVKVGGKVYQAPSMTILVN